MLGCSSGSRCRDARTAAPSAAQIPSANHSCQVKWPGTHGTSFTRIITDVTISPKTAAARPSPRATMRAALRAGAGVIPLRYRTRSMIEPPLVVLCDISGSMERYSRMLLHFLHALAADARRIHVFAFGTRLTNITRHLRRRDPDAAIAKVTRGVADWAGGTRIGESLATFNRLWARRVLGQNATVLLFTDGLDRSGGEGVELAARRLRASCRRLIWLNPLLRYEAYAPLAAGAQALRGHVSELRACHNLASLADLARALGGGRLV